MEAEWPTVCESPSRPCVFLEDMSKLLPPRTVQVCREHELIPCHSLTTPMAKLAILSLTMRAHPTADLPHKSVGTTAALQPVRGRSGDMLGGFLSWPGHPCGVLWQTAQPYTAGSFHLEIAGKRNLWNTKSVQCLKGHDFSNRLMKSLHKWCHSHQHIKLLTCTKAFEIQEHAPTILEVTEKKKRVILH